MVGGGGGGGGDLDTGSGLRISGILAALVLFITSSLLLKIESTVDPTEELKVVEGGGEVSPPAGLEKFVAAVFAAVDKPIVGSFNVCARLDISTDAKLGRGGIVWTLDSGDSGLLPLGLSVAALLAAR